ncbi:MAG TPA: hypothetical protein VLK37_11715 [Solirubrobacterales bacterium]|nr:hypothetical protein [Solirubrobacterales bacterium]
MTAPIRRRATREFRVHFSSILAVEDRLEREGIPVTSMPRTLLDLSIRAKPAQIERLLERAEEIELLDLFETHGTRAAFERDHLRQEELKLLGVEMIRVTRPRLQCEPDAVLRNLATFLERRRAELDRA